MKSVQSIHGLLLLGVLALPMFFSVLQWWPLYLLVPLTLYATVVLVVPSLRRSVHWVKGGHWDGIVWTLTATTIIVASAALVMWYSHFRYDADLSNIGDQIPAWPLPYLLSLGLFFSVVNALLEEIIFRGVLYEALVDGYGAFAALFIQALVFGLVHAHGFPRGVIGIVMATTYGVVLGYLRQRSGGLLPPLVAHIFADATIFVLVLIHVHAL
jgi:uncharacterized protein